MAAGTYYLKVQAADPFGQVRSFSLAVQVLAAPTALGAALDIYNSAGERVASLPLSPSSGVSSLILQQSVMVEGMAPGLGIAITDLSGAQRLLHWDGRNASGAAVSPGIYTLITRGSVASGVKTVSFQVLAAATAAPWAPRVGPNPAPAASHALTVQAPGSGQAWSAELYDLSGAQVRQGGGAAGVNGALPLHGLASGVYLVQVRTRDGLGREWRWTLKAAVLR